MPHVGRFVVCSLVTHLYVALVVLGLYAAAAERRRRQAAARVQLSCRNASSVVPRCSGPCC